MLYLESTSVEERAKTPLADKSEKSFEKLEKFVDNGKSL